MEIRRRPPAPSVNVTSLTYQVKVPEWEPKHILEEIVWHKGREVDWLRERDPLDRLKSKIANAPAPLDFLAALTQSTDPVSLIAEVKKASPSKGVICENFDPVAIAQAYERGGASCLSVLTDRKFFQGSGEYLNEIRQVVQLPLLCKEFIIYPYQIFLARTWGADAILLNRKDPHRCRSEVLPENHPILRYDGFSRGPYVRGIGSESWHWMISISWVSTIATWLTLPSISTPLPIS